MCKLDKFAGLHKAMQINLRVARGGISVLDDPNLMSAGRSCEWVDYALNYVRVWLQRDFSSVNCWAEAAWKNKFIKC
jgi:hypothetical protein